MAKTKRTKKVVVDKIYFDLLVRKADLLDSMFCGEMGGVSLGVDSFKQWGKIEKEWEKSEFSADAIAQYEEPK